MWDEMYFIRVWVGRFVVVVAVAVVVSYVF